MNKYITCIIHSNQIHVISDFDIEKFILSLTYQMLYDKVGVFFLNPVINKDYLTELRCIENIGKHQNCNFVI